MLCHCFTFKKKAKRGRPRKLQTASKESAASKRVSRRKTSRSPEVKSKQTGKNAPKSGVKSSKGNEENTPRAARHHSHSPPRTTKRRASPSPTSSLSGRPARRNTLNQRLQQRRASEESPAIPLKSSKRGSIAEKRKRGTSKDSTDSKDSVIKEPSVKKVKVDSSVIEREPRSTQKSKHPSVPKIPKVEEKVTEIEVNGESSDDTVDLNESEHVSVIKRNKSPEAYQKYYKLTDWGKHALMQQKEWEEAMGTDTTEVKQEIKEEPSETNEKPESEVSAVVPQENVVSESEVSTVVVCKNVPPECPVSAVNPQKNVPPESEVSVVISQENVPPESEVSTMAPQENVPPKSEVSAVVSQENVPPKSEVSAVVSQENVLPKSEVSTVVPEENVPPKSEVSVVIFQENVPPMSEVSIKASQENVPPKSEVSAVASQEIVLGVGAIGSRKTAELGAEENKPEIIKVEPNPETKQDLTEDDCEVTNEQAKSVDLPNNLEVPANNSLKESQSTTESVEKENQPETKVGSDSTAVEPAKTEDSDADHCAAQINSPKNIVEKPVRGSSPVKKSSSARSTLFSGQAKTGGRDWSNVKTYGRRNKGKQLCSIKRSRSEDEECPRERRKRRKDEKQKSEEPSENVKTNDTVTSSKSSSVSSEKHKDSKQKPEEMSLLSSKTPDASMPRTSPCAVSIERLKIVEQTLVASTGSRNSDKTKEEPDKSEANELVGQVSVIGDKHYTTLRESTSTVKLTKSDIIIVSPPRVEKKSDSGILERNGEASPAKELVLVDSLQSDDEKTLIPPPRVTRSNERSLSRGSSSSTVSGGPQDSPARGSKP